MNKEVFEAFTCGRLAVPGKNIPFEQIAWSKHPTFEGVELKHMITGKETDGQFSYHLVRIAPGKAIKNHIHETQLETHEVIAGAGVCINDGAEIKSFKGAVVRNPSHYFHPSISWGLITGRMNTFRFFPKGFIYDVAGMSIFPQDGLEFDKYEMLGLLNTKFYTKLSKLINPSVNLQCGDVAKFPFLHVDGLSKISEECVSISKSDWDAHETSWDFAVNELVDLDSEDKFMNTVSEINELTGEQQTFDTPDFGSIEERLQLVKSKWRARFEKLHENEEKLNRQFIEIYGLQDELTPDVPLDEVTILQQGEISIEEDG